MRADKETELIIRTTFCYDFLADAIQGLEELKPTIASGREIGNPWIHKTRFSTLPSHLQMACIVEAPNGPEARENACIAEG